MEHQCCTDNSIVVNSRIRSTKASGYKWIDAGIRWRQRKCKECGELFETYEGTAEELKRYFALKDKALLDKGVFNAIREIGEQLPGLVKRVLKDKSGLE